MSTAAQYASIPKIGIANISTANANRDGTGTIGTVITATATTTSGTRIDKIVIEATSTTTAGLVRLYLTEGFVGNTVTSMTFVSTTATVTTAVAHGRTTGDIVTMQGAVPYNYNGQFVITVTGASTFTYTMTAAPTVNAQVMGAYTYTLATPTTRLFREITVDAIVPSGTVKAFTNVASSSSLADAGYLPLILPTGWSLRASTVNAEAFTVTAHNAGDLS